MNNRPKGLIEEYEINPCTMLITPYVYGSKTYSQIFELEDEFLSPFKPIDIIKKSCEYFGSSYEGRKEGTKQLTGITHKVPIIIDPTNLIYFLPTTSPLNPKCYWVSHEHVLSHKRLSPNSTQVTFRNKKTFVIPVSYNSFENQLLRTALLRTRLIQRLKETERKALYFLQGTRYSEVSGVHNEGIINEIYRGH
nr:competence protein ComK [Bacillus sp. T33-2]